MNGAGGWDGREKKKKKNACRLLLGRAEGK
jgi:hypothetical protein